ncbi:DNA ligase [Kitasatospora aureofaciens]|uniref:ATP-dependent DNA ligase n=1 Tax=Kitasatospora aureofaciens TaxID=1894 RepID=UPI00131AC555|nr:DNA ligase [Kitasatospora aureofaciens]
MPRKAEPAPPLALHLPVELMQPRPVTDLPAEDAMRGGRLYEVKLDGIRACAARTADGAQLWSRRGRPLAERFPEVIPALTSTLRPGTVLDGELCAWSGGKLAFTGLLHTPRHRAADHVAVSYVVWDVLAVPGRDVRALPLVERKELLNKILARARPPIEVVMSTRSRDTALQWYDQLQPLGVEGLAAKATASPYRPSTPAHSTWVKLRHTSTVDALLAAITGSPSRPDAVLV